MRHARRIFYYLIHDWIGGSVFAALLLKSMYFTWVIASNGASKVFPAPRLPLFGESYILLFFSAATVSIAYLFKNKAHVIALLLVDALISFLFVGDLWYFRSFNDFLSLHLLSEFGNLHNLSSGVFSMMRHVDLLFVIDLPFLLMLAIILRKRYRSMHREIIVWAILFFVPCFVFLSLHRKWDNNSSDYHGPYLFHTQFKPYDTMQSITPIGYHLYDTMLFLEDNAPFNMSENDRQTIEKWLDNKNEKLPPNGYKGLFRGKSVIIIQVESLEQFVIGARCQGKEITPNLNRMLGHSLYFPHFYEQTNNGNSSDADLMINASVLPVRKGSTFFRFPSNRYQTLADIFHAYGYATRSIHPDDGVCWNVAHAISHFGFDSVMDMNSFPDRKVFWMGLSDQNLFEHVVPLLEKETKPAFYFTVTVSSHMPFVLPEAMHHFPLSGDMGKSLMGHYFQAVHYTDQAIGNFVSML
ncbi:MAG TPA: LTA synthase family protein, partial [Spirochaetota bacterium]